MNTIFVTGFVDLDRIEQSGRRGWDEYRRRFEWLLGLPITLIVYAEPDHLEELKAMPRIADVIWRETNIAELSTPEELAKLAGCIGRIEDRNITKIKDTPLLTIVGRQKVRWLEQVSREFDRCRYWWIDFGIAWDGLPREESRAVIEALSSDHWTDRDNRIGICSVTYVPRHVLVRRSVYYSRYWWPVASGWFGGNRHAVRNLSNAFEHEWTQALAEGCAPLDEMVHGWLLHHDPMRYCPHYGDYRSCIANTFEARQDHSLILWMSNRARYFGDVNEADRRFQAIWPYMTMADWKVYD
jgi:hypothetical protein